MIVYNCVDICGCFVILFKLIKEWGSLKNKWSKKSPRPLVIGNNALREKVYNDAATIGYSFPNIVVGSAYISPFEFIGTGCIFLNNVVVQNKDRKMANS